MTIQPWEAFLAGALVAADAAVQASSEEFDVSWERDVPVLMALCLAAERGDQATIVPELRDADPRALLSIAVGVLVMLANVAVARGEAADTEGVIAMWNEMARRVEELGS